MQEGYRLKMLYMVFSIDFGYNTKEIITPSQHNSNVAAKLLIHLGGVKYKSQLFYNSLTELKYYAET